MDTQTRLPEIVVALAVFFALLGCSHRSQSDPAAGASPDSGTRLHWFTFEQQDLCNESEGFYYSEEKLKLYGPHNLYDTTLALSGDTTVASFYLITHCSQDFIGEAQLRQDTLVLALGGKGGETAISDCLCSYRMTYRLYTGAVRWKTLKVIRGRLTKQDR